MLASIRAGRYMGRWFKAPQVMGQQARSQMLKGIVCGGLPIANPIAPCQAALNKSPALRRWVNAERGQARIASIC